MHYLSEGKNIMNKRASSQLINCLYYFDTRELIPDYDPGNDVMTQKLFTKKCSTEFSIQRYLNDYRAHF